MPPNPQNLRPPWPKGVSGNPNGRPKKPLQAALEAELDSRPDLLKAIIQKGLKKALEGDFRYWSAIYERIDGKVPLPVDMSTVDSEGNDYIAVKPRVEHTDIDEAPTKILE